MIDGLKHIGWRGNCSRKQINERMNELINWTNTLLAKGEKEGWMNKLMNKLMNELDEINEESMKESKDEG